MTDVKELFNQGEPETEVKPRMEKLYFVASDETYKEMQELGKAYGRRYISDIIRVAVKEAVAHLNCPDEKGNLPDWAVKLHNDVEDIKAQLSYQDDEEPEEPEFEFAEEPEEGNELPEIPDDVLGYLALQDKKFQDDVNEILSGNIVARRNAWYSTRKIARQRKAFIDFIREPGGKEAVEEYLENN
jgi:hypothetical protein